MFSRAASLFALALPLLASASAIPRADTSSCDTGTLQCCNSVQSSTATIVSELAGLLGLNLSGITGQVGVSCSAVSVAGTGTSACSAQPACCTGNSYNGVLATGCTPVNTNL